MMNLLVFIWRLCRAMHGVLGLVPGGVPLCESIGRLRNKATGGGRRGVPRLLLTRYGWMQVAPVGGSCARPPSDRCTGLASSGRGGRRRAFRRNPMHRPA
jgi:hypothetical protein